MRTQLIQGLLNGDATTAVKDEGLRAALLDLQDGSEVVRRQSPRRPGKEDIVEVDTV